MNLSQILQFFLESNTLLLTFIATAIGAFGKELYESIYRLIVRLVSARRERVRLENLRVSDIKRQTGSATTKEHVPSLPSNSPKVPYLYLTELRLQDFRCFSEAELTLRYPGEENGLRLPNVNLLLGDNGSGKSTVLRAAAMLALGPALDGSGFIPYRLVREGRERAFAKGVFAFGGPDGPEAITNSISVAKRGDLETVRSETPEDYWGDIYDESSSSFFVVGYGVGRRVADESRTDPSLEKGRRRRRYQRVSGLFDDSVALTPFGSWLPALDEHRRFEVEALLAQLVPGTTKYTGKFEGEDPIFLRRGVSVPFRGLSDGFRSYLGWLGDLLFHISAAAPRHIKLAEMGGIVLVDEIDLLLHPSWQRIVVPAVCGRFPNIQFIFTTHSPIVTGTLQSDNICVARERLSPASSALERVEAEVHGLNAEQVLLSSYFDLVSTRSPDAATSMEALARQAVNGNEDARRRYLEALSRNLPTGDSERD